MGLGGLFAAGVVPSSLAGQNASGTPRPKEKKLSAGEKEAKKLLLLMDKDENGMVSKEEFMAFMEAEFDRLDKDKSGQLDVQELTQSKIRSNAAVHGR
jgi:Ca2+-binding EF-hand superfamily protein